MNLIKTMDNETATLLSRHFKQLPSSEKGVFVFVNQPLDNFSFAEIDKSKIIETNTLKF